MNSSFPLLIEAQWEGRGALGNRFPFEGIPGVKERGALGQIREVWQCLHFRDWEEIWDVRPQSSTRPKRGLFRRPERAEFSEGGGPSPSGNAARQRPERAESRIGLNLNYYGGLVRNISKTWKKGPSSEGMVSERGRRGPISVKNQALFCRSLRLKLAFQTML